MLHALKTPSPKTYPDQLKRITDLFDALLSVHGSSADIMAARYPGVDWEDLVDRWMAERAADDYRLARESRVVHADANQDGYELITVRHLDGAEELLFTIFIPTGGAK
jgi:hypothetical protein